MAIDLWKTKPIQQIIHQLKNTDITSCPDNIRQLFRLCQYLSLWMLLPSRCLSEISPYIMDKKGYIHHHNFETIFFIYVTTFL